MYVKYLIIIILYYVFYFSATGQYRVHTIFRRGQLGLIIFGPKSPLDVGDFSAAHLAIWLDLDMHSRVSPIMSNQL